MNSQDTTEAIAELAALQSKAVAARRRAYRELSDSDVVVTTVAGAATLLFIGGLICTAAWFMFDRLWAFWPALMWQLGVVTTIGAVIHALVREQFDEYYALRRRIRETRREIRRSARAEPGSLSVAAGVGGELSTARPGSADRRGSE